MRILAKDLKRGYVELVPENEDDLWTLYTVLEVGDVVTARTSREVKFGGESSRVAMNVSLRVERLEFQPFTDRLRISGVVIDAPEEYGIKGKHHTVNVSPGSKVVVWKDRWLEHQLDRISRSALKGRRIVAAVLDYDEACIALVSEQGVKVLDEIGSGISGKRDPLSFSSRLEKYLEEVARRVEESVVQHKPEAVVVASPSDLADRVISSIRESASRVYRDSVSTGGCSGLSELLRRDAIRRALEDLSIVRAYEVLEEFKHLLVRDPSLIAYGVEEVERAVANNAVKKLVVSSELLRSYDEDLRVKVNSLLEEAHRRRAEISIVPIDADISREVMSFGGVIAVLRYSMARTSDSRGS